MLEQSAVILDAVSFSECLNGNFGVENLVHGNLEEIHMKDLTAHGMMLDLLDQRELRGTGDVEFHEDVLTDGVRKEGGDFTLVDLKIAWLILVTVDNGRNGTTGAKLLDGITADISAGPCGKFDLFCHGITKLRRMLLGCLLRYCLSRNSELTDSPWWMRRIPSPSNSAMERTRTRSPDPCRTGTLSVVMSSLISEPSNR